jgi:hypothetical protein
MARVRVDVTKAKGFEALIAGDYVVECQKVPTIVASKKSGILMQVLELVVTDGPDQPGGKSPVGRILFYRSSLEEGNFFSKMALDAFGVEYAKGGWETEDFVGKSARAKVAVREYEGEPTNDIKRLKPIGKKTRGGRRAAEEDDL